VNVFLIYFRLYFRIFSYNCDLHDIIKETDGPVYTWKLTEFCHPVVFVATNGCTCTQQNERFARCDVGQTLSTPVETKTLHVEN
jgi:hypothetical protein